MGKLVNRKVSQEEAAPVVSVQIPVEKLETVYKAVRHDHHEQVEFFVNQNPATQRMMAVVKDAYEAMSESLAAEVEEALK